ncbi:uncharacterized protein MONOS_9691 [Monocercomonoides exilis]|uniref:uncharacterized protein n=1 Tax=Monocercomonoides exilis TaxID=2049356 RepID=UPI00355A719D|nr:hypothetical protein MONOS_9691 [Monocercomonoides exilis]|eukprot:MONOS_9691.1-p1 / transcript=MONOS_9691.1 / gene=MONOS_9691 / organism=Monocercomonoides_exilis_PA203 / gene_product=unspecified product / transcript_product=unspecified product / location=Mono_scaffold00409:46254-46448(-) / protein_length=65 / sequence_SO=supercontig / SO=protein_coding / is_pseudo=false
MNLSDNSLSANPLSSLISSSGKGSGIRYSGFDATTSMYTPLDSEQQAQAFRNLDDEPSNDVENC